MSTKIWHDRYVEDWNRAFPLGNGRIGAMVYGNPDRETIEINEESLWSGKQLEEVYHCSSETLQTVRDLLFHEKYEEATDLCWKHYSADPRVLRFYESFGEIQIDFADKREYSNYRKELELKEAISKVSYQKGDTLYTSESFVSEKYDAFVYRMTTNDKKFSCNVTMQRAQDAFTASINEDTLVLNGQVVYKAHVDHGEGGEGMKFGARIHVISDGRLSSDKHSIAVEEATFITVYGAFATNYNVEIFDIDESVDYKARLTETMRQICQVEYETLKQEHIADHEKWFDTLSLELDAPVYEDVPTDERLRRMKEMDHEDLDLCVLYYNFGRYLLIESSGKRATLPANLQGKWCHGFTPDWGSDYHININMQMNYWAAEKANMSGTFGVVSHFVKMLSKFGERTAKEMYGAKGWATHLNTDIFGRTGAHDTIHCGLFPMSGPWLCLNLWEHYEFTRDLNYLREVWPIMMGACNFVMDFLIEDENGYLVTSPSNSPENRFYYIDETGEKKKSMLTYGATIDVEILYELFTNTIAAVDVLKKSGDVPCSESYIEALQKTLEKMPPLRISKKYGTICEWIKDYDETEPGHRHISHLFGLFPGKMINENNPVIYQAAKNTIARRVAHGCGERGWSRAWTINFYARFKDGDNAFHHLRELLKWSTGDNLFDMYPPFQIDGNFGGISGITEMLIQSHQGTTDNHIVELLPALPSAWKNGMARGLKARGNMEFDLGWEDNKVKTILVTAHCQNTLNLKLASPNEKFVTEKAYVLDGTVLCMDLAENEQVEIKFEA